jgi:hypothetical protein
MCKPDKYKLKLLLVCKKRPAHPDISVSLNATWSLLSIAKYFQELHKKLVHFLVILQN